MNTDKHMSRRDILLTLGSTGAALAMGCSSTTSGSSTGSSDGVESEFGTSANCALAAKEIEGPYYTDDATVRSDIRDDRKGAELRLRLRVLDAKDCKPISGAVLSVWHCDADGYYSGHLDVDPAAMVMSGDHRTPTSKERFLRGTQVADQDGVLEFTTIYPGWYAGRTVHIHFKIFISEKEMVTGQMYLPQNLNDEVLSTVEPYSKRGKDPVTNTNDFIVKADNDPEGTWPTMTKKGGVHVATITIGVQR